LWEFIAFPYELIARNGYEEYSYFVVYDEKNNIERVINVDTSEGKKLLSLSWTKPRQERENDNRAFTVKRLTINERIKQKRILSGEEEKERKKLEAQQLKRKQTEERFRCMQQNRLGGKVNPDLFFGDLLGKNIDKEMENLKILSITSEQNGRYEFYFLRGKIYPKSFKFLDSFLLDCFMVNKETRKVIGLTSSIDLLFSEDEMTTYVSKLRDLFDNYIFPDNIKSIHKGTLLNHKWIWSAPNNEGGECMYIINAKRGTQNNSYNYGKKWNISFSIINKNKYSTSSISKKKKIKKSKIQDGYPFNEFNINDCCLHGTGFFVSTNGYLVTNYHVIEQALKDKEYNIIVKVKNQLYNASIIRTMDTKDLALLKINKETMPIPISSLSFARLGQEVFTVGFPVVKVQGFSPKVSRGAISSLNGVNDDEMSY
jgi:hypothetical protein